MQTVRVTPVVGLPQFTGWSQVVDHVFGMGYHLVAALSIDGPNAGSIGRDIVGQLLDHEPQSSQEIYNLLSSFLEYVEVNGARVSVSAAVFIEGRCVLCVANAVVLLRRKNKLGILVQAHRDVSVLEGKVYPQDVFILATEQTVSFISALEQQFDRGFDVDGVITSVVPAIHAMSDSSRCALAFVTPIEQVTKTQQPPPISESSSAEGIAPVVYPTIQPDVSEGLPREKKIPVLVKKIGGFWNKTSGFVRTVSERTTRIFSKKTYVGGGSAKRNLQILIGIIVVCLLITIIAAWIVVRSKRQAAQAVALVAPYEERIATIEQKAQIDPISARSEMAAVVEELGSLQTQLATTSSKQVTTKLTETLTHAQTVLTTISGKEELSELPIFYDLRLASTNFVTTIAQLVGTKLVAVDTEKNQLVVLDIDTKQVFTKDDEKLKTVVAVSAGAQNAAVFLGGGVSTLELTDQGTVQQAIAEGDSNRAGTLLAGYETYLYVFNPEKRNIYRYAEKGSNYSEPIGWLQDPLGTQFTSISSMSVDGDVWLTSKEGEIRKFTSGKKQDFTITGLADSFTSNIWLTTTVDGTNLYILEPAKKRLVVLDKNGTFLREVKSESLASVTAMIADELHNRVLVVSGSIIYEIAL